MLESVVGKDFLPRGSGKYDIGYLHCTSATRVVSLLDVLLIHQLQGLLLDVLLSCSFIGLMKEENMQSSCTSLGRGSRILV